MGRRALDQSQDWGHTHPHTRSCRDDPHGYWLGSRLRGSQHYMTKRTEINMENPRTHTKAAGVEEAWAKHSRYAGALLISRKRKRVPDELSAGWRRWFHLHFKKTGRERLRILRKGSKHHASFGSANILDDGTQ